MIFKKVKFQQKPFFEIEFNVFQNNSLFYSRGFNLENFNITEIQCLFPLCLEKCQHIQD